MWCCFLHAEHCVWGVLFVVWPSTATCCLGGLSKHKLPPLLQVGIDLGAAPGAWTEVLSAQTDELVIAVDPAELSEACLALANVRHIKTVSKKAVEEISRLLEGRPVDIIVCDMNMLPHLAAVCVEPLLQFLMPGGYLIMSCKLIGNGRDRCAQRAHFLCLLPRLLLHYLPTTAWRL